MKILSVILAFLFLAGCAKDRQVLVPKRVEVVKYVKINLKPEQVKERKVIEPDAICMEQLPDATFQRVFCNGQVKWMLNEYRKAVDQLNSQIESIKESNKDRVEVDPN